MTGSRGGSGVCRIVRAVSGRGRGRRRRIDRRGGRGGGRAPGRARGALEGFLGVGQARQYVRERRFECGQPQPAEEGLHEPGKVLEELRLDIGRGPVGGREAGQGLGGWWRCEWGKFSGRR